MYAMNFHIEFETDGKRFLLQLLTGVKIVSSVENLADTATIVIPEYTRNTVLSLQDKIKRGSKVLIELGYNDECNVEFTGFVTEITNRDKSLVIECEDALFLFRNSIKNSVISPASIEKITKQLVDEIDNTFTVNCTFDFTYEKFTIHEASGFDVLKKITEETKANIYFDSEAKVLHIHPPFKEIGKTHKYRLDKNVLSSSLEYKNNERKLEIVIEATDRTGKVYTEKAGVEGGERITRKVSSASVGSLKKIVENEMLLRSGERLEGSFQTWLKPFIQSGDTVDFLDTDYPKQAGKYYCTTVTTEFNSGGATRTINLGLKLK